MPIVGKVDLTEYRKRIKAATFDAIGLKVGQIRDYEAGSTQGFFGILALQITQLQSNTINSQRYVLQSSLFVGRGAGKQTNTDKITQGIDSDISGMATYFHEFKKLEPTGFTTQIAGYVQNSMKVIAPIGEATRDITSGTGNAQRIITVRGSLYQLQWSHITNYDSELK